ncbi:MAG: hypothetical protein Q9179_007384 [Wetmoreana sp. 5 TL-2023]
MLNDLMSNNAEFKFLACTGATSVEITDQIKSIQPGTQDLLTISAGGNDVGFSTVLKDCVYLPGSEAICDLAISVASSLIQNELGSNITNLLDSALLAVKDKGVVVYTLYAKFFNEVSTACNDQSWVIFDPTGGNGRNFGLKLTSQRRQRMNQMVEAANVRIQSAISKSHPKFEDRGITLQTADWNAYVERIKGRFCEDGAAMSPEDNLSLVFQRQDNTPRFIPPERYHDSAHSEAGTGAAGNDSLALSVRSILPDDITRRFHPNFLGQSIIAQIALMQIAKARASVLDNGENANRCVLYPARPTCKEDLRTVISHTKFDGAVGSFCKNPSDSMVTTFESKSLDLRYTKLGDADCERSDCEQSMNSLYEACSDNQHAYRGSGGLGYVCFSISFAELCCIDLTSQISGQGQFHSECGIYSFNLTDPTPKFPPGSDAVDSAGSKIEPVCFTKENQYISQSDLDAAVGSYCDNDGKVFFKGDKQVGHAIATGPKTHIYTEGTDISKQTVTYYKYDDVCGQVEVQTLLGQQLLTYSCLVTSTVASVKTIVYMLSRGLCQYLRSSYTRVAALLIFKGPSVPVKGFTGGWYVYNCVMWQLSTNSV